MNETKVLRSFLDFSSTFFDLFKGSSNKTKKASALKFLEDGRYEIKEKLGHGASGIVYKVWDIHMKRFAAAKIYQGKSDYVNVETMLVGKLDHPNIAEIYDTDRHEDLQYLIMEYIEGPTLNEYCKKQNLLEPGRVVEIILDVCKGLDYAHKSGIIHRDIKPSNIMLDKQDKVKITDFGVAQLTEKTLELGIYGTPSYISPEQLKNDIFTNRSDIFSLGCVMYELLEGNKAFLGDNCYSTIYKVMNDNPAPFSNLLKEHQKVIGKILSKALVKDPKKRYQNCRDFGYDLSKALGYINRIEKPKKIIPF